MVATHGVRDHYGTTSLVRRIDEALHHAGLADGIIGWADLAPLDQFHVRGLGATRELAEALGIDAGAHVFDVGCGLGGPARFLAATYGCYVTGIDLSQPFIEAARTLTERCGLAGSVPLSGTSFFWMRKSLCFETFTIVKIGLYPLQGHYRFLRYCV